MAESPEARRLVAGGEKTLPELSLAVGATSLAGAKVATSAATAARALWSEEAARCRSFARIIWALSLLSLVAVLLSAGAAWSRWPAAASLGAFAAISLWVERWGATDAHYSPRVFRLFGWSAVLTGLLVELHLGMFSPAPIAVTLGVTFFGLGDDRRLAVSICVAAAMGHLTLSSLVAMGVVPDDGLLTAAFSSGASKVFFVLVVPAVFGLALWQARVSRRATYEAVERAQQAMREASENAARLDEARNDLEVMRHAGRGAAGPHTGKRAGDLLLGKVLGRGAMGEVYEATHERTGERAAVKVLGHAAGLDPGLVERFRREVSVTERVRSPHVVSVRGAGELEGGPPFLAMELLEGDDLGAVLRAKGRLGLDEVVGLVHQVAQGLEAVHREGVVHRDLKPSNVLCERRGGEVVYKIADFGVSKLMASPGTLTQAAVVGTPGYMSPEQATGAQVDERSDVFSLGALTYRALTGRPPFSGGDTPQLLFAVVYRAPEQPSRLCELPEQVDEVIAIALAKRPDERFTTPGELARALEAASRGELAPPLRERAARVIDGAHWGKRVKRSHEW